MVGGDEGYPQRASAIRMPASVRALAPAPDNAYILRMNVRKVKSEKLLKSGGFRR